GLAADGGRDLGGHGHGALADGPAALGLDGGGHHPVAGLGELDLGPVEAPQGAARPGVPGRLVRLELEPAARERPGRPAGVVLGHPDPRRTDRGGAPPRTAWGAPAGAWPPPCWSSPPQAASRAASPAALPPAPARR